MPNVSYNGNVYVCAAAIKGPDFIKLLDEHDCVLATFEGVSDFSDYIITGGEWEEPQSIGDCFVAVIQRDGTVVPSPHKCRDISAVSAYTCVLSANIANGWFIAPNGYSRSISIPGLSKDDFVLILSTTDDAWAQSSLNIATADNALNVVASTLPAADVTMRFSVTKLKDTIALS